MFLGDSITAGQYVDPTKRFSFLLEKSELSNAHALIFEAISGQTTRQALLTFPEKLYMHRPHMLIIQLGINDCNIWKSEGGVHPRVSLDAFRENLGEIIERSRIAGVTCLKLLTNHVLKKQVEVTNGFIDLQSQNEEYNEVIREVGRNMGVDIYDIATFWAQLDSNFDLALLLLDDGVHLSTLGHTIYGRFLLDRMLADLKR